MRFPVFALLSLVLFAVQIRAENWPGWRGPRGDGTSHEKDLPFTWSESQNIHWKTPILGKGHSSPIIWGDRVFVTTCLEAKGDRVLVCLDRRDGKVLWQRVVLNAKLEHKHSLNSFASSTPATDGKHVWVAFLDFPNMQVACYDYEGKREWMCSPGTLVSTHGFCSSPILHKDLLILNGDQDKRYREATGEGFLVALDKETGKERWRVDRPNRTRSYCTPILIHPVNKPEQTQLVLSGSKCVTGYDADTGKLLWIIDGPTEQYVASLVYLDDVLFLTTGFPEYHLMGISPDGRGNITKSKYIRWHIPHKVNRRDGASYVPSPIAANGHFYVCSDTGFLSCLETHTGERLWKEKLARHVSASPLLADGHLYFIDDDGTTHILKANAEFTVLHKNKLDDECYASPAISQGQLFIRGLHNLYCIGASSTK
ncbi:MAG TPA: PQQ-binding-like beta-propeller repeat protein [Gemmataceae bacterium]|nr:PQQ-binding-like beta-propeller repeat protein [Gemmataceae bacterium]